MTEGDRERQSLRETERQRDRDTEVGGETEKQRNRDYYRNTGGKRRKRKKSRRRRQRKRIVRNDRDAENKIGPSPTTYKS